MSDMEVRQGLLTPIHKHPEKPAVWKRRAMPKELHTEEARVRFEHGLPASLMGIDGTWRRDCSVNDVSETKATLTINTSIEGLQLQEFFLLLSSTGLAYRRCSLSWVNGDQVGITFLRQKKDHKAACLVRDWDAFIQ
jgi:hypothetical protein